jgi:cytochrome b6
VPLEVMSQFYMPKKLFGPMVTSTLLPQMNQLALLALLPIAKLFHGVLILHLTRVYLTGGFKAPREITWLSGVGLAVLAGSSGVTGYSLPWDQTAFWACKIVTSLPTALPLLGTLGANLLRGGRSVCQASLTRFYVAHTFILPLIVTTVLLIHFLNIRKNGISGPI